MKKAAMIPAIISMWLISCSEQELANIILISED
jgi:hypothetical protein